MSMPCARFSDLHPHTGNELRRLCKFHDIIIKVKDRTFPCHRIILSSTSDYFRIMFSGDYDEANKEEVELKGIDADNFELWLTHIYGGTVSLGGDNAYRLLRLSNYLGSQNLSHLCEEYLFRYSDSIPLNTALNIFIYAIKLGKEDLMDRFAQVLAENFVTVSKETILFHISLGDIEKILFNPRLEKHTPTMLDFISNWSRYHQNEVNFLNTVLSRIGLAEEMQQWFVDRMLLNDQSTLNKEPDTGSNNDGEQQDVFVDMDINEMGTFQVDRNQMKLPFILYTTPISHFTSLHQRVSQYKFINSNKLQHVKDLIEMPHNSYSSSNTDACKSIFVNDIHVLMNLKNIDKELFCLHPYWQDRNGMYSPLQKYTLKKLYGHRDIQTVAVYGLNIYLYTNRGNFLSFNCENNRWFEITEGGPMKTSYPNLVCDENCLYMIGGERTNYIMNSLSDAIYYGREEGRLFQYYDIREGLWRELPNMTYAHNNSASCIYNDILYVSGGENLAYRQGYVESYDFIAGKWNTFETSMPKPKYNHINIGYDDKLWFFGTKLDLTWYFYDLKEKLWSNVYTVNGVSNILDVEVPRDLK